MPLFSDLTEPHLCPQQIGSDFVLKEGFKMPKRGTSAMETISFEKWIWIQFIFLLKKTAIYIQRTDVFDDLHSAAKLHAVYCNWIIWFEFILVHCIALSIFWLYIHEQYVYHMCIYVNFNCLQLYMMPSTCGTHSLRVFLRLVTCYTCDLSRLHVAQVLAMHVLLCRYWSKLKMGFQ